MTRPRAAWLGTALFVAILATNARADAPSGRFVASNGTVFDTVTQLLWQQRASDPLVTFLDATRQCSTLNLGGKAGWRLPRLSELHTLVDERRADPALDPAFPASTGPIWTATQYRGSGNIHWTIDFSTGITVALDDDPGAGRGGSVRCVQ
jgi:hypothetical protein